MSAFPAFPSWWVAPITVELRQYTRGSQFNETVSNGVGGSSGTNTSTPVQRRALAIATRHMPAGTVYRLVINGRDCGQHTKE